MPISAYYHGHGEEVMRNMKREYGEKKGKEVFYATANKRHMKAPHRKTMEKFMSEEKRSKRKKRK